MKSKTLLLATVLSFASSTNSAQAQLPDPGVELVAGLTALLITDPQNDFLSPEGVTRGRGG